MMKPSEDAAVTAFQKLADISQYRSDLYRLLALSFSNPTEDLIADLQSGALVDNFQNCLEALGVGPAQYGQALRGLAEMVTKCREDDARELLKATRVEYMRLFVGPKNPVVPVYETLHREKATATSQPMLIVSDTAVAVEAVYRNAGVQLTTHDSPDHLATELEFLVYLCDKEAAAWDSGNNTLAKKWRRMQREFIDEHLGQWAPGLCRQTRDFSNHWFYRYVAWLAETFLAMEAGAFQPQRT